MKHFLRWACVLLCVGSLFVACTREKTSSIAPAQGKVGTTDIPYYFDREITDKDLQGRTLRELSLMRNTIYARAGNEFSRKWLHEYFTAQPWYKESGYDESKISKLDRKNAETIAKRDVYVDIREVDKPELNALLVGESIAVQLEKRIAYRRAMRKAVEFALKMGAKGIKVMCAGRLGGVEIARSEWYLKGQLPLQTLRADIDFAFTEAFTTYGQIGIKVWVYRADVEKPKMTSQMAEVEEI